ncbi:MAG: fibronectin type III domain-containing protein [Longimicrobiales bacterium]
MKLQPRALNLAAALLALPLVVSSCSETDLAGRILLVEAEGAVTGLVFLDRNGNEVLDVSDDPVEGLEVSLFVAGTQSLAASAITDENGIFVLDNVSVGRHRLEADDTFFGDSLIIFDFDDAELTLRADENLAVTIGVTFPSFSLAEVRGLPVGRKGFTEGIVLNPRDRFGDGSVHLQAGDTYLRVVGTPRTALFPGDSVRILGRAAQDAGQPILREGEPFLLAQQVVLPQPLEFTTLAATTAADGLRDAALVRVRDADIVDTATVTGPIGRDLVMTIDDGSGPLDMVLLELGGFDLRQVHPDSFSIREASGLLVPSRRADGSVRWRLIPRSSTDLAVDPIPFPGQVIDLTVVEGTSATLTLNWTEVDDGFGNPSSYTVRFRPSTTLAWTDVVVGDCAEPIAGSVIGEVISCTVDGLDAETIYFFQVRPFRGTLGVDEQFGPRSNVAGASTLP